MNNVPKFFRLMLLILIAFGLFFVFLVVYFNFFEPTVESPVARTKGDLRTMTIAIETYYLDYNNYPAWSLERSRNANRAALDEAGILKRQPTFRLRDATKLETLTTPVGYIGSYLTDRRSVKDATFSYWNNATETTSATGYIIWSQGMDRKYDLSIDNIAKAYDPKSTVPTALLIELTYDPSNGTESRGDIWRVKQ